MAIAVTLIAPGWVDSSWLEGSSDYQVQMYEVADPNIYISKEKGKFDEIQCVHHLKDSFTLLNFSESFSERIISSKYLNPYITRYGDKKLKLCSRLLLLREPVNSPSFLASDEAFKLQKDLQKKWIQTHPDWKEKSLSQPRFTILELYDPLKKEAFTRVETGGILENWVDEDYEILDKNPKVDHHFQKGVIYVKNPREYRISESISKGTANWNYDPKGHIISSLDQLKSRPLNFLSRKELIEMGENIYKQEGCWYCHTDQTRTLDSVVKL